MVANFGNAGFPDDKIGMCILTLECCTTVLIGGTKRGRYKGVV